MNVVPFDQTKITCSKVITTRKNSQMKKIIEKTLISSTREKKYSQGSPLGLRKSQRLGEKNLKTKHCIQKIFDKWLCAEKKLMWPSMVAKRFFFLLKIEGGTSVETLQNLMQ